MVYMDSYDVFDFLVQAEFARWSQLTDEFISQGRTGYDGPRQTAITIPLCLHLTVSTRS